MHAVNSRGEISPEPMASSVPPVMRRRSPRTPVELMGGMRQSFAAAVSVRILDLSLHGFRVETHLRLEKGQNLWMRLPGLEPRHAKVAWVGHQVYGCLFTEPLHQAVLEAIVKR